MRLVFLTHFFNRNKPLQLDRKTLLFAITIILIFMSLFQQSKLWLTPSSINKEMHLLNAIFHAVFFSVCAYRLQRNTLEVARNAIVLGFASYISIACLLWQSNLNIQYYFLLGLFVCSYIYDKYEEKQRALSSGMFMGLFLFFQITLPYPNESQEWLKAIAISNAILMSLTCALCAQIIRATTLANWQYLQREQAKQQQQLFDIIPQEFCEKLTSNKLTASSPNSQPIIKQHPFCSIVFADFSSFTRYCNENSKHTIIHSLHHVFSEFDRIARYHGLSKIKTNGDQYIVMANSNELMQTHKQLCYSACLFALEIRKWFQSQAFYPPMDIRIGIASGSVTSGVIGQDKPAYDIWGHSVNLAARLEEIAVVGQIACCQTTFIHSSELMLFTASKDTQLKGLGKVDYFNLLGKK